MRNIIALTCVLSLIFQIVFLQIDLVLGRHSQPLVFEEVVVALRLVSNVYCY